MQQTSILVSLPLLYPNVTSVNRAFAGCDELDTVPVVCFRVACLPRYCGLCPQAARQVDHASVNLETGFSFEDDGELADPRRTVSLPAELPEARDLNLQVCEPVKETEVLSSETPEKAVAQDAETPRLEDSQPSGEASPRDVDQCKDDTAQAETEDAPNLEAKDKEELHRLQQLAEEFSKVEGSRSSEHQHG